MKVKKNKKIKINLKKTTKKQITINNNANDTVSPVPQNQQKTRQSITKKTNKQKNQKKKQRIAKKKNPHN